MIYRSEFRVESISKFRFFFSDSRILVIRSSMSYPISSTSVSKNFQNFIKFKNTDNQGIDARNLLQSIIEVHQRENAANFMVDYLATENNIQSLKNVVVQKLDIHSQDQML